MSTEIFAKFTTKAWEILHFFFKPEKNLFCTRNPFYQKSACFSNKKPIKFVVYVQFGVGKNDKKNITSKRIKSWLWTVFLYNPSSNKMKKSSCLSHRKFIMFILFGVFLSIFSGTHTHRHTRTPTHTNGNPLIATKKTPSKVFMQNLNRKLVWMNVSLELLFK